MNKAQLIAALAEYPDDWDVWIDVDGSQAVLTEVDRDADDAEKTILLMAWTDEADL